MWRRSSNGVENNKQAAWMNETPAVILNVQRQPGANTISVVKSIKKLLPQLQANLPAGIQVTTLTDLTTAIQSSVSDVEFELMLTIGLVVLVIFLFLRSLYATIIPSVAVPLSLVGTFAAMYMLGYSLDNLSLMALTISTGFVVDDAIVMIENISRYIEEGDPPMEAALKGAEQIGFTILSLTVSLIAVLIPLLFMGDVVGRLFREFAVTLAVTIIISAVVSLDPDSDDERAHPAAPAERTTGTHLSGLGTRLRTHDCVLWAHPEVRPAVPDDHPVGRAGHAGADDFSLYHHSQGFFPGAGYRRHSRHLAGAADDRLQSHGRETAGDGQGHSGKIPPWKASRRSLAPMVPTRRSNSGRMSINLKPLDQRDKISASDMIRRLNQNWIRCRESSCSCSRCRTSRWMIA